MSPVVIAAWIGDLTDPSSGQIAAAAALVQTVVVVGALWFARGQLAEARSSREATERPFVVIEIDGHRVETVAYLVITNYGHSMAWDITFEFNPPLRSSWKDEQPKLLTDGMASLAPGREIAYPFDGFIQRHKAHERGEPVPDRYEVTVRYTGEKDRRTGNRRPYEDPITLDFGQFAGMTHISRRTIHDVHEQLEKLRKAVERMSPSTERGVLMWTPEGLRAAHAAQRAAFDEQHAALAAETQRDIDAEGPTPEDGSALPLEP